MELEGKKVWGPEIIMEALSSRYGWTPQQIREQSVGDIYQYLEIIKEQHALEARARKQAAH